MLSRILSIEKGNRQSLKKKIEWKKEWPFWCIRNQMFEKLAIFVKLTSLHNN